VPGSDGASVLRVSMEDSSPMCRPRVALFAGRWPDVPDRRTNSWVKSGLGSETGRPETPGLGLASQRGGRVAMVATLSPTT